MDVLIVTNMYPTPARPALGPFVRDQVDALRRRGDVGVELFHFPPGPRALAGAARALRRRYGRRPRFDVVHAHFGLTAWPALLSRLGPVAVTLHGNDLLVPRSRAVTLAALPFCALVATASRELAAAIPGAGTKRRVAVLPVGIDTRRFIPIPRTQARARLGLPAEEPFALFPHDPARPLKRHDRAVAAAAAAGVRLRVLGGVPPADVPLWVNAANAVLVPSSKEGFGLSVIEALACDVPVLGTPVGIHPVALAGVPGAHCLAWDRDAWAAVLAPYARDPDPRADGRRRAELFSAEAMADRTVVAWQALLEERAA